MREFGSEIQGFRGGSAWGSFVGEVGKAFEQVDQGELDLALFKALNRAGGILFHYPASQSNRVLDSLWRANEGEDVAPIEFLLGRRTGIETHGRGVTSHISRRECQSFTAARRRQPPRNICQARCPRAG